jgi:hypothetical protein
MVRRRKSTKSKKSDVQKPEVPKQEKAKIVESLEKEEDVDMDEESGDEQNDESGEELMADSDVDNMEKLSVDFEALPPHESDLVGLVNLVTQVAFVSPCQVATFSALVQSE